MRSLSGAHAGGWLNRLLGAAVVVSAWLAAFAMETAARLHSQTLRQLGAEGPVAYGLAIDFVKGYGPWVLAALITASVVFLALRKSARYLHACIVSAVVATVMVSLAALALSLPLVICADFWPAWQGSGQPAKLGCR